MIEISPDEKFLVACIGKFKKVEMQYAIEQTTKPETVHQTTHKRIFTCNIDTDRSTHLVGPKATPASLTDA